MSIRKIDPCSNLPGMEHIFFTIRISKVKLRFRNGVPFGAISGLVSEKKPAFI